MTNMWYLVTFPSLLEMRSIVRPDYRLLNNLYWEFSNHFNCLVRINLFRMYILKILSYVQAIDINHNFGTDRIFKAYILFLFLALLSPLCYARVCNEMIRDLSKIIL